MLFLERLEIWFIVIFLICYVSKRGIIVIRILIIYLLKMVLMVSTLEDVTVDPSVYFFGYIGVASAVVFASKFKK